MFEQPRKAYVLMGIEPGVSIAPTRSWRWGAQTGQPGGLSSAFKHAPALEYADVMLPIAPFTETSGTFVNTEGRVQVSTGGQGARAIARPAWKVLRVLGNVLNLDGFAYETSEGGARRSLARRRSSSPAWITA